MIEFIQGNIAEISPATVVVETNGVGYLMHISLNSYEKLQGQKQTKVFIHEIIREDTYELYGFFDKTERNLFRDLISVSGVGANTARLLLSSLSPSSVVSAIVNADVALLKSVKGLGEKTAQRIIVDLKNKINKSGSISFEFSSQKDNTIRNEALSALQVLGFDRLKADKVLEKIVASNPQIGLDELTKTALKNM
ncbi:MAG: Holliday junction branch migration protein RuvA [Bacteroidia bacterium]